MWDARLEAIRDRKLNEMIIFAAMIRTDMSKRHEYATIIKMLNDDLDLIQALADNGPIPETSPIAFESYRSRLSKLETIDEYCFDSCRKGENDFGPIICKEHVTTSVAVKQDASVAVQEKAESPAVIPEYPKPVMVEEKEASLDMEVPESPSAIPIHAMKQDVPEVIPPEEPSTIGVNESEESEGIYDFVLSIEDAVSLKRTKEMKDRKIDLFIEREMTGHFKDDACEDVITFLKTDIKLIDLILSIDVTSKDDIECKIREIVSFVNGIDPPKHTNLYINSLNHDERGLEGEYNNVLKRLEDVIAKRYSHLLDGETKVFFE